MKKIIIFTAEARNFVPVKLKKEAEELGVEAQIIDVTKTVLVEDFDGKTLHSNVYLVEGGKDEKPQLTPIKVDKDTTVIPRLNEHHTEIKIGILKRFENQGATLLNTAEGMELCNDKLMTQIILNSAGIKTPYSVMVQRLHDIETVVSILEEEKKIKYPFVIKTLRGTHGIGVMKLDSRGSLVSVAQTLAKEGHDFMLQEFCKHERSARIIMLGQEMLAANLRGQPKEKDEFRTNSHLGSETEKYEPSEEELEIARKIVKLFGCNFCAIDYLLTDKKEIIVLEVNGSPGLENIQKNWPNKNLAKTIVEYIKGEKNEEASEAPSKVEKSDDHEAGETTVEIDQDKEAQTKDEKTIAERERCTVHRIIDEIDARIDTGAEYCSLHVDKVDFDEKSVKFTRGDVTYRVALDRIVKIKNVALGTSIERPVVRLDITLKGHRLNGVEFTLNNRANMKYEVLIGRRALADIGLPVIVSSDQAQSVDGDVPETEIETVEEE